MRHNSESGFALVLVVWLVAALALWLATFARELRVDMLGSAYLRDELVAEGLARGATRFVAAELTRRSAAADEDLLQEAVTWTGQWTIDTSQWRLETAVGGTLDRLAPALTDSGDRDGVLPTSLERRSDLALCQVTSESALFPLHRASATALTDLGVPAAIAAEIAAGLTGRHSVLEPRSEARAGWRVDEVLADQGVDPGSIPTSAKQLLTVTSSTIDPNAASVQVLEALPDLDLASATAIVSRARERPLASIQELRGLPGLSPSAMRSLDDWLTFAPELYRVRCTVTVRRLPHTATILLRVVGGSSQILRAFTEA